MQSGKHEFQNEFDRNYVTTKEIVESLNVTRATIVNARSRGILPKPVKVAGARTLIWKRSFIQPYLDAWRISLASRRGELK